MRKLLPLLFLALVSGCADDETVVVTAPTAPAPIVSYQIEYRVTGTGGPATIRYTNTIDGLTQTISGLPFSASVRSSRDNIFISLDVIPQGFGFVNAQIFVNGYLWREGSTTFGGTVTVSGTLRRSDLP
jgi:hypothetical protein